MVQKLFFLKLEPDLDPKPEKLSEHGPGGSGGKCHICVITTLVEYRSRNRLLLFHPYESLGLMRYLFMFPSSLPSL